jgi:hypothetical protein
MLNQRGEAVGHVIDKGIVDPFGSDVDVVLELVDPFKYIVRMR